jgi:hypothetical protein
MTYIWLSFLYSPPHFARQARQAHHFSVSPTIRLAWLFVTQRLSCHPCSPYRVIWEIIIFLWVPEVTDIGGAPELAKCRGNKRHPAQPRSRHRRSK